MFPFLRNNDFNFIELSVIDLIDHAAGDLHIEVTNRNQKWNLGGSCFAIFARFPLWLAHVCTIPALACVSGLRV